MGTTIVYLRAMTTVYVERRAAFERCINEYLPHLRYRSPQVGLHGTLLLDGKNDTVIAAAAGRADISSLPLSSLHVGRARSNGLLLGFGVASPGEIRLGVRTVGDAIAQRAWSIREPA